MNTNFKFLLIGTNLSLIPNITYAQCTTTPNCAEMGYKETANKGGCLKCPVGNGWYCPDPKEEKAVLGECTGYAKNCSIGQILNSDGTCTTDKVSGKTPLGVIIAIKDNCGWAMTANPIQKDIMWSVYNPVIADLTDYNTWQEAAKDYNSCDNTQKIILSGGADKFPAAWEAVNYTPNTAQETKGKWCLPAAGLLTSLYSNLNVIDSTISKLNGTKLSENVEWIWSSSERSSAYAWHFSYYPNTNGSNGIYWNAKNYNTINSTVRPVIAF